MLAKTAHSEPLVGLMTAAFVLAVIKLGQVTCFKTITTYGHDAQAPLQS